MFNWFKKKKKNPDEENYVEKEIGEFLESQEGDQFGLEPKNVINEDVQDEISLEELEKEALSFKTEEEIDIIEETNEILEESVGTREGLTLPASYLTPTLQELCFGSLLSSVLHMSVILKIQYFKYF